MHVEMNVPVKHNYYNRVPVNRRMSCACALFGVEPRRRKPYTWAAYAIVVMEQVWGQNVSPFSSLWSFIHNMCGGDLYIYYCFGTRVNFLLHSQQVISPQLIVYWSACGRGQLFFLHSIPLYSALYWSKSLQALQLSELWLLWWSIYHLPSSIWRGDLKRYWSTRFKRISLCQ